MQQKTKCFYDFRTFRLDPVEHVLLSASGRVPLTLKAFETHRREVSPMNRPKLEIYCISAKFPTASATDSKCDNFYSNQTQRHTTHAGYLNGHCVGMPHAFSRAEAEYAAAFKQAAKAAGLSTVPDGGAFLPPQLTTLLLAPAVSI